MSLRRLSQLFKRSSSKSLSLGSQNSSSKELVNDFSQDRQILLIGLDKAGKTSICNSLSGRK